MVNFRTYTYKFSTKCTIVSIGNPLRCDCKVRPFSHYLATITYPDAIYEDIECASPKHVAGYRLLEAPDEYLNCMTNSTETQINAAEGNDLDLQPDIRFRDIL